MSIFGWVLFFVLGLIVGVAFWIDKIFGVFAAIVIIALLWDWMFPQKESEVQAVKIKEALEREEN